MRRFILAVILLSGILFMLGQMAEVEAIVRTTQQGDWRFILVALTVTIAWIFNVALSYKVIYQATGIDEKIDRLVLLAFAANFANVVAPTAGMSGMAVLISDAKKRGYPLGRVTAAGILFLLMDYAGFLCVLSLGLVVLFRRHNLNISEIVASIFLLLVALGIAALMYMGMRSSLTLGNILARMARLINHILWRFLHRPYLSEDRAHQFAMEIGEGLLELRARPQKLFPAFTLALLNKTLLISILFFTFLAFKAPFTIGTLVAGFSVAYLFMIVSPTPSGIGVVEGVMTLVLRSMYIPLGKAALISLAFRGITFWLPLVFGLLAFRHLERTSGVKSMA